MEIVIQEYFRRNVSSAMEARGFSQSELARRMSVGRAYVSCYLVGRKSPGINVIEKFSIGLDVPACWLIDETPIEEHLSVHA